MAPKNTAARLRGFARRVRDRVAGPRAIGDAFGPSDDRAFAQLDDVADSAFALVGSAIVSTWEVTLTDVGRAMSGRLPEAERVQLIERLSDAIVPTLGPIQGAGRRFRAGIKAGVKAGLRSGSLADATAPLGHALAGLTPPVREGWETTTGYLAPVFDALPDSDSLRTAFAEAGAELAELLDRQAAEFADRMAALPEAPALEPALVGALDAWQQHVVRGLEHILYDRRTVLVEAARRLPATGRSGEAP